MVLNSFSQWIWIKHYKLRLTKRIDNNNRVTFNSCLQSWGSIVCKFTEFLLTYSQNMLNFYTTKRRSSLILMKSEKKLKLKQNGLLERQRMFHRFQLISGYILHMVRVCFQIVLNRSFLRNYYKKKSMIYKGKWCLYTIMVKEILVWNATGS